MNIKKLRALSIGLAVLLVIAGMAGCGSKKSSSTQASSGAATESKTEAAADTAKAENKTDAAADTAKAETKADAADAEVTADAAESAEADSNADAAGTADPENKDGAADTENKDGAADTENKTDAADATDAENAEDAGTKSAAGSPEKIVVVKETLINQGGSAEAEVESADIYDAETGDEIEDTEVRIAETGNQNIESVSTPAKDDKGVTSQEIKVKDGSLAPCSTQAAIEKYIAETVSSADGNVTISLKFDKPCDEYAQKSYSEFFEKMAAKYGGITFDTNWTVPGLG